MNTEVERDWLGSLQHLNKKLTLIEKENHDLAVQYSFGTHEFLYSFIPTLL